MARNRMLSPEFWLDEELAALSPHARLLYMGLWGICDDNFATFPNKEGWIKAQIFPYESVNIHQLLGELSVSTHLLLFQENGEQFWYIKNFFKYQKVERPSKPKYPQFKPENQVLGEPSVSPLPEVKRREVKLKEVKGREEEVKPPPPKKEKNLDFVFLTLEEKIKLIERMGEVNFNSYLASLNNYIGKFGDKYKSHYHVLLDWFGRDEKAGKVKKNQPLPISELEAKNKLLKLRESLNPPNDVND